MLGSPPHIPLAVGFFPLPPQARSLLFPRVGEELCKSRGQGWILHHTSNSTWVWVAPFLGSAPWSIFSCRLGWHCPLFCALPGQDKESPVAPGMGSSVLCCLSSPHCLPRQFRGSDPLLFSLGSKNSILKDAMAAGTPKVSEHSSVRFTLEGRSLLPIAFPAQSLPCHSLFPREVTVLGCPQQCHALGPGQQRGCCPHTPTVLERLGPCAAQGQ